MTATQKTAERKANEMIDRALELQNDGRFDEAELLLDEANVVLLSAGL